MSTSLLGEGIERQHVYATSWRRAGGTKLKIPNGRSAKEEDANSGNVIFYIPDSRSTPYQFHKDLPLVARILSNDGVLPQGSEVTIVQAERTDSGDVLLGLMFGDGEEGLCQLEEIELLD